MVKNILILVLSFYILVLLQTSFLIHFKPFLRWQADWLFILMAVILINLFEKTEKNLGIFSGLIGGFFLDIFSENFFGFYISILLLISIFIKFILRRYVRVPIIERP